MTERMKKIGRNISQGLLSIIAFALVLLALLQIGLMIGFAAFNTGKGRAIVEERLQAILAQSGYDISIGALFYDPVRGLTVYNVSLRDEAGPLADLDRLSVGIVFEKLPFKTLELFASGGNLAIHRLPQKSTAAEETEKPPHPLQPFTLPDIYFTKLGIDYFAMDSIVLDESIAGRRMVFSPRLRTGIALDDEIAVTATLRPRAADDLQVLQIPEEVSLQIHFHPAKLSLVLNRFLVSGAAYDIQASGQGVLQEDGTLDFALAARPLTANNFEKLSLNAAIAGTYAQPLLEAKGMLAPLLLKQRGLSDIVFAVSPLKDDSGLPKSAIEIQTAYRKQDIVLQSHLIYDSPRVRIEELAVEAPFANLSGQGVYDTAISLFEGDLSLAVEKLSHYSALAGFDLGGTLIADIQAHPVEERQSLTVSANLSHGQYDTITLRKLDADLSFADILSSYWPQSADLRLNDLKISPDVRVQNALVTLKEAETSKYALALNAQTRLPQPVSFKGTSTITSFTAPLPSVEDIALDITLRRSTAHLRGSVDPETIALSLALDNVHAADLPGRLPRGLRRVALNGVVNMTGSPAAPVTVANITAGGLTHGQYEGLSLKLNANHQGEAASIDLTGSGPGIQTLSAHASFPLSFALQPFVFAFDKTGALQGRTQADLDMAAVSSLFLQPTQILSGGLDLNANLGGTVAAPQIAGTAALSNAAFTDEQNGIEFADLSANARFTQEALTVTNLTATDGEAGTMQGKGKISFTGNGTDLFVTMNNFHLPKSHMANGCLNAELSLRDSGETFEAQGDVVIQSMDILIPETFQSQIPELNIIRRGEEEEKDASKPILLDIDVAADNQFFVRGWGLDAEFGGNLAIHGSVDEPLFDGVFDVRRGRYEEFGKRFELARANLRFQGTIPPSPYLDIEATTEAEDVTASVLLTGSASSPSIAFSSIPALPEDEVLARILFGKSSTKISPFQAVQLAQTIQRFSGRGGSSLDPLGTLRNLTGLDDISVETDTEGQTSVGAGKYLTDNVYLEYEQGQAEGSGAANLQIEVTPSITIESEIGQDAQGGGGIFWKHDY